MRESSPSLHVDPGSPLETMVRQDWQFLQTVGKPWLIRQRVPGRMVEDILQAAWINTCKARGRSITVHPEYISKCVRSAQIDIWRAETKYVFPDALLGAWGAGTATEDMLDALAYRHACRQRQWGSSPETPVIKHDLSVKLRALCARLGAQDKTYLMILRRYCDEAAPAQIAQEFGVTRQTVYNRTCPSAVAKALGTMRQYLLTPGAAG